MFDQPHDDDLALNTERYGAFFFAPVRSREQLLYMRQACRPQHLADLLTDDLDSRFLTGYCMAGFPYAP